MDRFWQIIITPGNQETASANVVFECDASRVPSRLRFRRAGLVAARRLRKEGARRMDLVLNSSLFRDKAPVLSAADKVL